MRAIVLLGIGTAWSAIGCGPGSEDGGVCKEALIAGDLVITEVFADFKAPTGGTGADEGKEWFEIFNASARPLDLQGLTITHSRPDGDRPKLHVMKSIVIEPGQFFTLGNSVSDLLPPYVDYGYSADLGDMFNSDGGKLALGCGDTEVDAAVYDAIEEGHSRELSAASPPDYTFNDDLAQWCQGNDTEFEAGNFGTPGSDNDCVPVVIGQCSDGGTMREVVLPAVGDLVITEVMPSPSTVPDEMGEWIEVRVLRDIDFNGVGIERADDSRRPDVLESATCLRATAGSNVLFAKSNVATLNGNLPASALRGRFGLSLVPGTESEPGDVQLLVGATVIDAVTWTGTTNGRSHQLDPDLIDPIANDAESNTCDGTTIYNMTQDPDPVATDFGTPGAANLQCVLLPPAGMCDDNGTLRAIVKPAPGALVITEVMVNPVVETPAGVQEWFEIANTGATAFDLNELGLDQAAGSRMPDVIKVSACKSVAPGGLALFAHTATAEVNGGLVEIDATYGFTLSNAGGDVQVVDGTTVLDAVSWGRVQAAADNGVSRQLDPDRFTTADNDLATGAGSNFCPGATAYGDLANKGTPRTDNAQCP